MHSPEPVLFEKRGGVATVTLNRPDKLNAITWRMMEDFLDFVEDVRQDDSARVLVFTGAGRAFSAATTSSMAWATAHEAVLQVESMPTAASTTSW